MLKRVVVSLALLLFVFANVPNLSSAAKDPAVPPPPPPTEEFNSEESLMSTLYLKVWQVWIQHLGDNVLNIMGDTEAYEDVDIVRVTLYIQYWNGSQWVDGAYVGTFEDYDTDYVWGAKYAVVSSGYHYRTKGIHYVNKSGSWEQVNSYSGSIYIP